LANLLQSPAWRKVSGLSEPSKMPCLSYSIPASACRTGGKLRKIPGSVCSSCYARKGHYIFPHVKAALRRRLGAIFLPGWVEAMVLLINAVSPDYFRWHDSGDLQSIGHLRLICQVAERTPLCRHWLPTHEYGIVESFLHRRDFPKNLTVRLTAQMIDGELPTGYGLPASGVSKNPANVTCPAGKQGGKCGTCRKCWDRNTAVVIYRKH
jgi:hypothetical protein